MVWLRLRSVRGKNAGRHFRYENPNESFFSLSRLLSYKRKEKRKEITDTLVHLINEKNNEKKYLREIIQKPCQFTVIMHSNTQIQRRLALYAEFCKRKEKRNVSLGAGPVILNKKKKKNPSFSFSFRFSLDLSKLSFRY